MLSSFSKRPAAILFDYDGVLVASEKLHWSAWGKLLQELGIPYREEELCSMAGQTAPQIMAQIAERYRPGWKPGAEELNRLALRKNDFYVEQARTLLQPYPGVPEGLQWLRENGIRTAIVTNARKRELVLTLDFLGLGEFFEFVLSREDSGASKPDPRAYLCGADRMGLAPEDCLAVEDSPPGLQSALIGGIPAAAVLTNFCMKELETPVPGRPDLRPVWIGESMELFFSWLKTLR